MILALQLGRLQIVGGEEFRLRAELNRLRLVSIPASRGLIYDRHGQLLVENRVEFLTVLTPALLPRREEERVLAELSGLLGLPAPELAGRLGEARSRRFPEIVLKGGLSREEAFTLRERLPRLPGVELREEPRRFYPYGESLAHLLGYVGPLEPQELASLRREGYRLPDRLGKTGVELLYESYLRGQAGLKQAEVNANGRELRIRAQRDPRPGLSLSLTIDAQLQALALEALREAAGEGVAAAIVMDVRRGELLALASLPTFDSNRLADLSPQELAALLGDPRKPLLNHALAGAYPPGSPFKLVTALAALQEGIVEPGLELTSRGRITIFHPLNPNLPYIFFDPAPRGPLDLPRALALSANVYFLCLAGGCPGRDVGYPQERLRGLGPEALARYARAFGLGRETGLELPGEVPGQVPDPRWKEATFGARDPWSQGDSYRLGLGRSFLRVTPLQMAVLTAAVANGGQLLRPQVVGRVQDYQGQTVLSFPQELPGGEPRRLPVAPESLAVVHEAMERAVAQGTAQRARLAGQRVAGLATGPADAAEAGSLTEEPVPGWFVGFAPADSPQVAVVVLLKDGQGDPAQVAGRILAGYFR